MYQSVTCRLHDCFKSYDISSISQTVYGIAETVHGTIDNNEFDCGIGIYVQNL